MAEFFVAVSQQRCVPAQLQRSVRMVLIKVQYDAYNRQFKLLDRELAHALNDGENYLLIANLSIEDLKLTDGAQIPADVEQIMTQVG
jgi:hypothetical protein